jgi:phage terminase large subunit GpA-like protein
MDIQKDCVKVVVRAVGAEGKRWATVHTAIIPRVEELKLVDVKAKLADIGDFPVQGARRKLTPSFAVDSGHWTHDVYRVVYELQQEHGEGRFILVKGVGNAEGNARPYTRSSIREIETPSGEKLRIGFDMELMLVNGHYYKDLLSHRLAPLSEEAIETLRATCSDDAEFERMLDEVSPEQLPDAGGWPLCDTVLEELTAEEKVLIGQGSGRSGKDGMGKLRRVWRKRIGNPDNDFFDCFVYSTAMGDRANVRNWTPEIVSEMVGRAEAAVRDQAEGVYRAPKRAQARPGTIAGDAAKTRIF